MIVRSRSKLLGLALGAAVTLAGVPALAADDSPEKLLDGLLTGLGLQKDTPSIDYRERSPLVIPPSSDLPAPKGNEVRAANWPVDPEIRRQREIEKQPGYDGLNSSLRLDENSRPLPISEIEKGRTKRRQNNGGSNGGNDNEMARPLTPTELGTKKGGLFGTLFNGPADESAKFTGEPPRTSLIDPPTGYQTPSPDQPYALSKDKGTAKPTNYLIEHTTPSMTK